MKKTQTNLKKRNSTKIKVCKTPRIKKDKTSKAFEKTYSKRNKLSISEEEFIKCMKTALREALEENERLKEQEINLNSNNNNLNKILDEKIDAVKELANYFSNCQFLHLRQERNKYTNNKQKPRKK